MIFDELAQAKNRDLYDVLDSSFGSRAEPLYVIISTQSNDPEHILSKLIDDGLSGIDPSIVCHLHAADDGCELGDEAQWKKANRHWTSFAIARTWLLPFARRSDCLRKNQRSETFCSISASRRSRG